MIEVTNKFIEPYLKGTKKHAAYQKTVDIADHLKFHFEGYVFKDVKEYGERENPYFLRLIDQRRPSESDHIKEYRRKIYLPKTKQPCFKIINSLKKIVKSPDWNINYSKVKKPASIIEGEQLEDYCEKKLPFFGSVENWFYSYAIKELLTDPNGLVCVLPTNYDVKSTDFRKPYPYFISSENVYDFVEDEYAIFRTNKTYEYPTGDGKTQKDFVISIATNTEIWEAKKINAKGDYELKVVLSIKFNKMPVFRIGGVYKEIIDNSSIFESYVSAILPGLDAAAREQSDLDAEVVQHIFTTMWYYASQGCSPCAGTGKVNKAGKGIVDCEKCSGSGVIAKSPYKDLVVKAPEMGETGIRAPFAGYIEKNVEIVKIQDERIKQHIYESLSAINMEFLAESPLNQSGKAKEVDKDELNTFAYSVGYHAVTILNRIYYFINEIRVMDLNLTEETKSNMLPKIVIPERFEILSENYLQEQVSSAKTGQINPLIVGSLEIEFVNKKFENFPEIREKIKTIVQLDPLPGMTPEQKDNAVLAGNIMKEDAMVSNYIGFFVERAIQQNEGFLDMDYDKKYAIVQKFAQDKLGEAAEQQKQKEEASRQLIMDQIGGRTSKAA